MTTPELKGLCKGKMFSHVGKRTPVAVRFSTVRFLFFRFCLFFVQHLGFAHLLVLNHEARSACCCPLCVLCRACATQVSSDHTNIIGHTGVPSLLNHKSLDNYHRNIYCSWKKKCDDADQQSSADSFR